MSSPLKLQELAFSSGLLVFPAAGDERLPFVGIPVLAANAFSDGLSFPFRRWRPVIAPAASAVLAGPARWSRSAGYAHRHPLAAERRHRLAAAASWGSCAGQLHSDHRQYHRRGFWYDLTRQMSMLVLRVASFAGIASRWGPGPRARMTRIDVNDASPEEAGGYLSDDAQKVIAPLWACRRPGSGPCTT